MVRVRTIIQAGHKYFCSAFLSGLFPTAHKAQKPQAVCGFAANHLRASGAGWNFTPRSELPSVQAGQYRELCPAYFCPAFCQHFCPAQQPHYLWLHYPKPIYP